MAQGVRSELLAAEAAVGAESDAVLGAPDRAARVAAASDPLRVRPRKGPLPAEPRRVIIGRDPHALDGKPTRQVQALKLDAQRASGRLIEPDGARARRPDGLTPFTHHPARMLAVNVEVILYGLIVA